MTTPDFTKDINHIIDLIEQQQKDIYNLTLKTTEIEKQIEELTQQYIDLYKQVKNGANHK